MAPPVAKFTVRPRYWPFMGFRPLKAYTAWGTENFKGVKKSKISKFLKTEGDSEEMSTDIK